MQIKIPKLYPWQKALGENLHKNKYFVVSRQAGKTTAACTIALKLLYSGKRIVWLGKTHDQIVDQFSFISEKIPLNHFKEKHKNKRIVLKNGAFIKFFSAEKPDNIRGNAAIDFIVWDEFAFAHKDCFKVVQPFLSKSNGKWILLTTPNGHNHAHERWLKCINSDYWECFTADWRVSPHLTEEAIQQAKDQLTEAEFRQEYEAQFLSPTGAVFPPEWLEPTNIFVDELPKNPERKVIAVDMSAGELKSDYQAIALLMLKDGAYYFHMELLRQPPDLICKRIKQLADEHAVEFVGFEKDFCLGIVGTLFKKMYEKEPPANFVQMIDNGKIKKEVRILRLGRLLSKNKLKIIDNKGGRLTYNQLCDYPVGSDIRKGGVGDDGIDAIEQAWRLMIYAK